MKIGKLEFDEEQFRFRKKNENIWYEKFESLQITDANDLRIYLYPKGNNKSLGLHITYFKDLQKYIVKKEKDFNNNEYFKLLKNKIENYEVKNRCYVYIICREEIPVYVGYSNKPYSKASYWGSSKEFKAIAGDKKYIVSENLYQDKAQKIENFFIKNLSKSYELYNRTYGSYKGINQELVETLSKIDADFISCSDYETHIKR